MAITALLSNASTLLYRPLGISAAVLSGEYVNVPTFAQLGLEISDYGSVYGIAVSPQTPESLRQEMAMALFNVSNDPEFGSDLENLGALVILGFIYESVPLNNFINYMISIILDFLNNTTPTPSPQSNKSNTLPIILGVIIPLVVVLALIVIIFALHLKFRSRSKWKLYDSNSFTLHEIGKRRILESKKINWDEVLELQEIGVGS